MPGLRAPAVTAVALACCALVPALASPAAGATRAVDAAPTRVVLAFLPSTERTPEEVAQAEERELELPSAQEEVLNRLDARKELALGLVGATQGRYNPEQALLDIGQGTRTSVIAYDPDELPDLEFVLRNGAAYFVGWDEVLSRARNAPADIDPGLLASNVPGGSAYAGVLGRAQTEALAAADRTGTIAAVSIGRARELAQRTRELLADHRFVVVGLPTGGVGGSILDELLAARGPRDLLIVVRSPPDTRAPQLLPAGVAGLGRPGALISDSTRLRGVVAAIDLTPTILRWLAVPVPDEVKGQRVRIVGERDADALDALADRLAVLSARRFPALETLLFAWVAVLLALGVVRGRDGTLAAMRLGALAIFWVLPVLLLTAVLHPSRRVEIGIVVGGTLLLAALTDRFVRWPRGPLVPAAVTLGAYGVDLALGSDYIIRSLLGPNPRFGSRYFGIGNELEAALPLLLFLGLAAYLGDRPRSRGTAAAFAAGGAVLALFVGAGRLGADVGGVITVAAGAGAATLAMLPGGVTRRAVALAVVVPALALALLAVVDLVSGGNAHFTRAVLRADDSSELGDIFLRRYELAFNVLRRGLMPFATLIAILAIAYGLRHRERLFAPLGGAPAWNAALIGSLASAVAGALFNDSGPLLLIFGAFILAWVTAYVRGDPRLA